MRVSSIRARVIAIEYLQAIPDVDLTSQTILITGTTTGIGTETARALALRGAHIIMANRNIVQAEALKNRLLAEKPDAKIDLIVCDLSSLQSVQAAANEYKEKQWSLHALVLNAGIFSPTQKMTIDGLEMTFGVNHVAHQYLVRELLPLLRQSSGRIVVVSSHSHNHTGVSENLHLLSGFKLFVELYAYSKLCNVLMAMKLHRDENKYGISVYVLHPGSMIGTGLFRPKTGISLPFTKSLEQGAATTVYCAASPEVANVSGKYWESCWDDEKNLDVQLARDEELQDALWEKTNKLLDSFELSREPIKTVTDSEN
ncbi:unnamed protein product [Angiostrongylus costaricensis]|uniref:Uncharacterized protein n=1 Tax=Angiostrongylus costaricensis TaxID=334426 RepID=A0A3P7I545_ANGCS|nr:unnamed protein product [Angiostrongylus costaricensis]